MMKNVQGKVLTICVKTYQLINSQASLQIVDGDPSLIFNYSNTEYLVNYNICHIFKGSFTIKVNNKDDW